MENVRIEYDMVMPYGRVVKITNDTMSGITERTVLMSAFRAAIYFKCPIVVLDVISNERYEVSWRGKQYRKRPFFRRLK